MQVLRLEPLARTNESLAREVTAGHAETQACEVQQMVAVAASQVQNGMHPILMKYLRQALYSCERFFIKKRILSIGAVPGRREIFALVHGELWLRMIGI